MTRKKRRSQPQDPTPQKPEDSQPRDRKAPRKTRPKQGKSSAAQERAPRSETAAAEETEARQPAKADETAAAKPARVSLPAFGFAEDLLQKPAPAADGSSTAAPVADAGTPSESDPHRIFLFADSLDQAAVEVSEPVPVRLETWVAFSLAGEVFALPVDPVREVVRVASITRVPHAPRPIRGVTNMRGRVIPVIDLRLRIELPEASLGRASRVIVVGSRGRLLGLLVDAVHQVIHIDPSQIQPPPEDVMTIQSDYLSGVYHLDDQLILLLDIDRALIIRDAEAISPATAGGAARGADGDDAPGDGTTGDAPAGPP